MPSTTFKTAAFGAATDEVVVILLTIDHDDLLSPIYVCSNTENVVSNGRTFIAFAFSIELPNIENDAPPTARIEIENVTREITQVLTPLTSPPVFSIEVVLASTPDIIEAEFHDFLLTEVDFDAERLTGTLAPEDFTHEPCPARTMDKAGFPGLHA